MTKRLPSNVPGKLRPTLGFAHFFHLGFVAFLPLLVFVFVRVELFWVAFAVILLSKWRIFAVRPRHWLAHVRTNAVDIIFSVSILAFMSATQAMSWHIIWVIAFEIWVLYLKPGSNSALVSLQALIAQLFGLIALFVAFSDASLGVYVVGSGLIAYFTARHFFASFEEKNYDAYSWTWSLFAACTAWILSHWLLFYGEIAQPAVLLSVLAYGLGGLYYLSKTDRLSKLIQRQLIFVVIVVVSAIVLLADWGSGSL